jgi:hypothetical protein
MLVPVRLCDVTGGGFLAAAWAPNECHSSTLWFVCWTTCTLHLGSLPVRTNEGPSPRAFLEQLLALSVHLQSSQAPPHHLPPRCRGDQGHTGRGGAAGAAGGCGPGVPAGPGWHARRRQLARHPVPGCAALRMFACAAHTRQISCPYVLQHSRSRRAGAGCILGAARRAPCLGQWPCCKKSKAPSVCDG